VLELDTQGSELEVLRGADALLRDSVLALQVEVEFTPTNRCSARLIRTYVDMGSACSI
jgi:hypothetical protein